jgi:hypothetical protein
MQENSIHLWFCNCCFGLVITRIQTTMAYSCSGRNHIPAYPIIDYLNRTKQHAWNITRQFQMEHRKHKTYPLNICTVGLKSLIILYISSTNTQGHVQNDTFITYKRQFLVLVSYNMLHLFKLKTFICINKFHNIQKLGLR